MAFVPERVKIGLPPWKAAWLRTTIRVMQLTVKHPVTGEFFSLTLRGMRGYWKSNKEKQGVREILLMWAEEKAQLVGLTKGVTP